MAHVAVKANLESFEVASGERINLLKELHGLENTDDNSTDIRGARNLDRKEERHEEKLG